MEELLGRLVAKVGVGDVRVENVLAITLEFLIAEGPAEKVQRLIDQLRGG